VTERIAGPIVSHPCVTSSLSLSTRAGEFAEIVERFVQFGAFDPRLPAGAVAFGQEHQLFKILRLAQTPRGARPELAIEHLPRDHVMFD
jgi:hypothetical protein